VQLFKEKTQGDKVHVNNPYWLQQMNDNNQKETAGISRQEIHCMLRYVFKRHRA
jgi:tRNA1(Val) A37 N6-methylase TrmN6